MTDKRRGVRLGGRIHVLLLLVVASIGASAWQRGNDAPVVAVRYVVDPAWPRPLPAPRNASGQTQQWVTGDVSGSCIDARDHLVRRHARFPARRHHDDRRHPVDRLAARPRVRRRRRRDEQLGRPDAD